jgi:hypothetical protein
MWRVLTTAGAALLILAHCDVGFAQVSATPGMGATSPLGSSLSNQPSMPGGVPLGATELDSGGLSPTASATPCSGTQTTAGSSSNFDGGGTMSNPTIANGCTSGTSSSLATIPSGTGSTSTGSTPGSAGGAIPLGSTELGTAGESPAAPTVSSTGCAEISSMASGVFANGC